MKEKKLNYKNLTIIIPTLNEEKNIEILLKKILKLYPKINIIITDDGSTDKTKNVIEKFKNKSIRFIDRKHKKIKGLTASVLDGLTKSKTDFNICMDGDLQHPPATIKGIYEQLISKELVIASRKRKYIKWERLDRKFFSDLATILANFVLFLKNSKKITDPMSGYFGIKKSLFMKLNKRRFVFEGYKILFDILKQTKKETKISEVFFNFDFRNNGKSKMRFQHSLYLIKSFFT